MESSSKARALTVLDEISKASVSLKQDEFGAREKLLRLAQTLNAELELQARPSRE